ncbi:hypothetical protein [Acidovorax sp.]|uniref:hypothetical protein n=1 Tax=Acidovorax sp. TaxID=1872122 RepID=UPI00391FB016
MSESPLTQNQSTQACQEAIEQIKQELDQATRVQTPGGVFEVQWSNEGKATAIGQLAFFAEFLQASGLFENWRSSCPLRTAAPTPPRWLMCWAPGCWASSMDKIATPT